MRQCTRKSAKFPRELRRTYSQRVRRGKPVTSGRVWICDSFWMSRAFIREDVDPPERSGRKRAASGLPPGAVNYITTAGAARLQAELTKLRVAGGDAELEQILGSIKIVNPPGTQSQSVSFGATVTVSDAEGKTETYTVASVDELAFEPDAVSWISPIGKTLLLSKLGDRIPPRQPNSKHREDRIISGDNDGQIIPSQEQRERDIRALSLYPGQDESFVSSAYHFLKRSLATSPA